MFKLQPKPTFWVPVSIPVPGEHDPAIIELEMCHRTADQVADLLATISGRSNAEVLTPLVKDWRQIDEPFSADNFALLLNNYPGAPRRIVDAWLACLKEGLVKN